MKKYKIITSYPCLIKSETQELSLDCNYSLLLEGERNLSVYPIGKGKSFAFNVNLNNLDQSPFFCTATEGDMVTIFLIDGLKSENANVVTFGNGTSTPSVEIGRESVTFHSKTFKRTIMTGNFENFDCYRKYDISLAHLFDEKRHLLIAFNEKTGKAKSFRGEKVEVKNDKIVLTQNFDDLAGHNIESTYKIDNEGLKKIDCQITYKYDKPRIATNEKVVPFAFLEAIKAENYELASSYFSSAEPVSPEKLKDFISKVDFFFPISENKFAIQTNGELKTIIFEMSNSKISDMDLK